MIYYSYNLQYNIIEVGTPKKIKSIIKEVR